MSGSISGLDGRSPSRVGQPRREVMVEPEAVAALLRLRVLGWGSRRIARELGISRGTVKRYVEAGGWQPLERPRRSKVLDGLDDWLRERFRRHQGNADVVRQELAAEKGIDVGPRGPHSPAWLPVSERCSGRSSLFGRSWWPRPGRRCASRRPATVLGRPPLHREGCGRRPQRVGSCRSISAATPSGRPLGDPGRAPGRDRRAQGRGVPVRRDARLFAPAARSRFPS